MDFLSIENHKDGTLVKKSNSSFMFSCSDRGMGAEMVEACPNETSGE